MVLPLVLLAALFMGCSRSGIDPVVQESRHQAAHPGPVRSDDMPPFHVIDDPIESFNRGAGVFNEGMLRYFIHPFHRVYRLLFPEPVREHLGKFGYNLAFPKRFVTTALQGKFRGTWDETNRFLINTTIGIAGIFDPATKWGIPTHEEDFGQTFGGWGMGPGFFFNIPVLGPSSGRDVLGTLLDIPFDIAFWAGGGIFFNLNDLSFHSDKILKQIESLEDPYPLLRDAWAMNREVEVLDFVIQDVQGDPDETLGAVFLTPRCPRFWFRGKTRTVRIPWTGKKFPYTVWPQKNQSPMLVILPGLGSHRSTESTVALAEMAFRFGYTPVVISSTMHPEFMTLAGSGPYPGYIPLDCTDLSGVLGLIHEDLHDRYPGRFRHASLMGISMGAFQALYLSAMEIRGDLGNLEFMRYLAINAPKSLAYGVGRLDDFYHAPLNWEPPVRAQKMRETIYKALGLKGGGEIATYSKLPITRVESEYLIGLNFRLILKDLIYASQQVEDSRILSCDPGSFRREPCYDEIRDFGFSDYMERFSMPWLMTDAQFPDTMEKLLDQFDLEVIEDELRNNDRVRLHVNENDFLLRPSDIEWMEDVFEERLIRFPAGGHLGNLYIPEVQDRILGSLSN